VQTGSEAHPGSYLMGTGGKRPGREVDHLPSSSAEVKSERTGTVKDEAYLFYIRTQCVPRCKHSPLRL
jgi:hypothetical protein